MTVDLNTETLETCAKHSAITAEYMKQAKIEIDKLFSSKYAASHPELVVAFMKTTSEGVFTGMFAEVLQKCTQKLADAIEEIL